MNGFRSILDRSYCDEQERVNFAMIICLFSVSNCPAVNLCGDSNYRHQVTDKQHAEPQSPMRPQALGCLLNMIGFVLNEHLIFNVSSRITTLLELDTPQIILLRWGNVVPWCWSTWKDPRIANTENVTQLVSS